MNHTETRVVSFSHFTFNKKVDIGVFNYSFNVEATCFDVTQLFGCFYRGYINECMDSLFKVAMKTKYCTVLS